MDWLSAASGILGGLGSLWSSNNANSLQRENLEKQMEFNREVMQNRHQWEVEDLRQAGLNPLMSVTSPTGTLSAPSSPAASKTDFSSLSNTAVAMKQLSIVDKEAEAQLLNAKTNAKNADTAYQSMVNTGRDIDSQIKSRQFQNDTTWQMVQAQMDSARSQAELNKANTVKTWIENQWYPRIQAANLTDIQTRIANSIKEVAAKIQLMDRQGQAALTNAAAQTMIANTLESNGVSLRELNSKQIEQIGQKMGIDLLQSEIDYEIKEAKANRYKWDNDIFFSDTYEGGFYRGTEYFGKQVSNVLGLTSILANIK